MIGCISRVFKPWTFCGAVVLIAAGPVLAQNLVFTPVLSAPVGAHPEGLTVGDFNEDGHLDIATANSDSDDVSVLLGNGNGTFRSGYSFGVGKSPMFLTTGDLNLDGTLDLAVARDRIRSRRRPVRQGERVLRRTRAVSLGERPDVSRVG